MSMSSEKHKLVQIQLASRNRRRTEPNQVHGSSEAMGMSYRTETQAKHLSTEITCTIAVSERQWL